MASPRVVIFAAVLTSVLADGPFGRNLEEKQKAAKQACAHLTNGDYDTCYELCLYKNYGTIDKNGRYVESGGVDLLALSLGPDALKGKVDPLPMIKAARSCKSVNDKIVAGCERVTQIFNCLTQEYDKIILFKRREEKKAAAKAACSHLSEKDICHKSCVYKSFKVLDEAGNFKETEVLDLLAETYPDLRLENLDRMALTCQAILAKETKKTGCERAHQFSTCFEDQYTIINRNLFGKERAIKRTGKKGQMKKHKN